MSILPAIGTFGQAFFLATHVDTGPLPLPTLNRSLKYRISRKVVEAVLNLNPPGRFLEMSNDGWRDASAKKVNEKATQALR